MNKDLLGNDFTRNIDMGKIDKNIVMVKVVLIIGSLYSIGEICRWIKLMLPNISFYLAPANFHYLLLFIFTTLPLAILFIFSWLSYLKANRLMKFSIETSDPQVFNKAYTYLNRSSVISIIGTCISLFSMLIYFLIE